jgi:hypothetical protein
MRRSVLSRYRSRQPSRCPRHRGRVGKLLARTRKGQGRARTSRTAASAETQRGGTQPLARPRWRSAQGLAGVNDVTARQESIITVHKNEGRTHLTPRWCGGALTDLDLSLSGVCYSESTHARRSPGPLIASNILLPCVKAMAGEPLGCRRKSNLYLRRSLPSASMKSSARYFTRAGYASIQVENALESIGYADAAGPVRHGNQPGFLLSHVNERVSRDRL